MDRCGPSPDGVESGGLGLFGLSLDGGKQFGKRRAVGEVGNLQSESNGHTRVQRRQTGTKFRREPSGRGHAILHCSFGSQRVAGTWLWEIVDWLAPSWTMEQNDRISLTKIRRRRTRSYRLSRLARFEFRGWRMARRGDYRVTYRALRALEDDRVLYIGRVEHRAHVYRPQ
jgi:hypothetical protein